jgi:hypothetical protein
MEELTGDKKENKAFIHDTLSYGIMSNMKKESNIRDSIVK